ncbi:MAG: FxsA family protein [Planctomycetales bacterium]|nr:FxsA family protein [Planctomycetales bacterium]
MRLLLLFVLVPFCELMILLKLAELTSAAWTLTIIVVTGMIGAALAKRQGVGVITRLRAETARGQIPTTTLVDALMIFVAGALLITPGVLTDLFGFSLLVPWCRQRYRAALLRWFKQHTIVTTRVVSAGSPWHRSESGPFDSGPVEPGRVEVIDSYVVGRDEQVERLDKED